MTANGVFIVFEGLDGSGISTQSQRLETHLRGRGFRTVLTHEPTESLLGGFINSALRDSWKTSLVSLQLLFCADRAKHLEDEIEPALKKGKIVICDRYFFSTLAYGFASGIDFKWLYQVNKNFRTPDLTIFVDIHPDVSMRRIRTGREKRELFEKSESLNKVRRAYLNLAKRFGFRIVNGENSVDETSKEIFSIVDAWLERRR